MTTRPDYISAKEHKGIYSPSAGSICASTIFTEDCHARKIIKTTPIIKKVTCLAEFFKVLKDIHTQNKNENKKNNLNTCDLFFYRGQANVNWNYLPTILRSEANIKRENILFKEFHRRFYERFDACKTALEEEVLMQHYGVGSRCLDLMENPLVALWAACEFDPNEKNPETFGEVSLWKLNLYDDELKAYDSSTVSVIADTAKQNSECFSLGHIEMEYHKEHPTEMTDFIYLKDILWRSAVVRPKYNNDRIRNQQGAFAIVNLNKMIDGNGDFKRKTKVSIEDFERFVLEHDSETNDSKKINIRRLRDGTIRMSGADFSKLDSWDIWFQKMPAEKTKFVDFYDLYKYMYNSTSNRNNERTPVYIVIPPEAKKGIMEELKYLNITAAYIYPEIENVSKEMKEDFGLEK